MSAKRAAAFSLCLLAVLIPAWWGALHASEVFRALFVRPGEWGRLQPFVYADIGLAIVTGLAGAKALSRSLSAGLAGLVVGGWGYATLWTAGATLTSGWPALGAVLMVAAFVMVSLACHALVSTG
jgi:hypothetical protein